MHFQNSLLSFSSFILLSPFKIWHLSTHGSWQFSSLFSHSWCGEAQFADTNICTDGFCRCSWLALVIFILPLQQARPLQHRGTGNNRVRACENYGFSNSWDTSWAHRREIWRCWEPWSSQPKGDSCWSQL